MVLQEMEEQYDVVCAFNAGEEELKTHIHDREVLIFRSGVQITANVMAAAPHLKLLIRAGSGIDNIDMDYVRRRGLTLVRIPQPGAKAVAELTFALMLALARHVLRADALTRRGRWAKYKREGEGQISPLADLPNVILTPHIGAMTVDSQREIGERILTILGNFENEQAPVSAITL